MRPWLVSKGAYIPAILAFLGRLGGLVAWGLVGVFLGPVVVAVWYAMILKWIEPATLAHRSSDLRDAPMSDSMIFTFHTASDVWHL